MEVFTRLPARQLAEIPAGAQLAEALGFDGITCPEIAHDPFLQCVLALEHTQRLKVGTSIAVAFVRSPMVTAYCAWDLQRLSGGRFELGLGSQVKGHNERRFSVPWSPPAPRMRECALAIQAVWNTYQTGAKLDFRGKHYTLMLMNHEFDLGPNECAAPRINMASIGPAMCRVAGEVCSGALLHGFTTKRYTEEEARPQIAEGARRAGRDAGDVAIVGGGFIATGATEEEMLKQREAVRFRVAWYGSTRTYSPVLDLHGWHETSERLHELSVQNKWDAMPNLINEEMLDTFCTAGTYDQIVPMLRARYAGVSSRISFPFPTDRRHGDRVGAVLEELRRM